MPEPSRRPPPPTAADRRDMKLTWCPESAGEAYLDAVRLLPASSDLAELVAAMAGGFRARLILEAPSCSLPSPSTSIALRAASRLTSARLVRLLPPSASPSPFSDDGFESVPADSLGEVDGVDFALVDCDRTDAALVLRSLRVGPRGAVVVCRGGGGGRWWKGMVSAGNRVVRSAVLPIGKGVEILHVGVGKGPSLDAGGIPSRWIKHIDRNTGEEHVFRR